MDDLAQFSPRRRPVQHGKQAEAFAFTTPIVFTLGPSVPLGGRRRDPHAWRPRLG